MPPCVAIVLPAIVPVFEIVLVDTAVKKLTLLAFTLFQRMFAPPKSRAKSTSGFRLAPDSHELTPSNKKLAHIAVLDE